MKYLPQISHVLKFDAHLSSFFGVALWSVWSRFE